MNNPVTMRSVKTEIKKSLPPSTLGPCKWCKFWQRAEQKRIIQTANGVVEVSELIKNGIKVAPEEIVTVAFCAEGPLWQLCADTHWCSRYMPDDRRLDQA